jgi:hypothetical protein
MQRIRGNARHVLLYEDPYTLAEARKAIPIERLETAAAAAAGCHHCPSPNHPCTRRGISFYSVFLNPISSPLNAAPRC